MIKKTNCTKKIFFLLTFGISIFCLISHFSPQLFLNAQQSAATLYLDKYGWSVDYFIRSSSCDMGSNHRLTGAYLSSNMVGSIYGAQFGQALKQADIKLNPDTQYTTLRFALLEDPIDHKEFGLQANLLLDGLTVVCGSITWVGVINHKEMVNYSETAGFHWPGGSFSTNTLDPAQYYPINSSMDEIRCGIFSTMENEATHNTSNIPS